MVHGDVAACGQACRLYQARTFRFCHSGVLAGVDALQSAPTRACWTRLPERVRAGVLPPHVAAARRGPGAARAPGHNEDEAEAEAEAAE